MSEHSMTALIAAAQDREGNDPIFALNTEAFARVAAGESILNATMGSLAHDESGLAVMPSVTEAIAAVSPQQAAGYSLIAGSPPYVEAVKRDLFGDTELYDQSVAVATPGGSGAVYNAILNFVEEGHSALTTEYFWGPYPIIAKHLGRGIDTFRMFGPDGRLDFDAMQAGIDEQIEKQGRVLLILNFPCHNPTGYSLDTQEWQAAAEMVREAGARAAVACLLDIAYHRFGGPDADEWLDVVPTMLETATVIIAWTASKSFCQYGARVGALVALHREESEREKLLNALAYTCRATWSNSNHLGQLAVTELLTNPELKARADAERQELVDLLQQRVEVFNAAASVAELDVPRYEGGFFVAVFSPNGHVTAATMRDMGVYVIPMDTAVRVALCATSVQQVPRLIEALRAGVDAAETHEAAGAAT
jgi:aromatic-amino-acid transaminase